MNENDTQKRDKRTIKIMIIAIASFFIVLTLITVAGVFIYFKFFAVDHDIDSDTQPTVTEARLADMVLDEGTCFGEDIPQMFEGFYRMNRKIDDVEEGIVATNVFDVKDIEQLGIVSRYQRDGKRPALNTQIYRYDKGDRKLKALKTRAKYKNEMWPIDLSLFNSVSENVYKFECKGELYIVDNVTTTQGINGISYLHKIWQVKGDELVEVIDLQFNTSIIASRRVGSYKLNGKEIQKQKIDDAIDFLFEKHDNANDAETNAKQLLNNYYSSCIKEINNVLSKYKIAYATKDGTEDGGYDFQYLEGKYELMCAVDYDSSKDLKIVSNNLYLVPSKNVKEYRNIKDNYDEKLNKAKNSARENFKGILTADKGADINSQDQVIIRKDGEASDKSVVIYDLNGDGVEEMFYLSRLGRSDTSYNIIYASSDKENNGLISYAIADGLSMAANKEFSSAFAIYMSKNENNTFYIAIASPFNGGEFGNFSVLKYKASEYGRLELQNKLENIFRKNIRDDYYIDDKEVSAKEGANKFASTSNDAGQLLMYSGDSQIIPVFASFGKDEDKAISYQEAMRNL